MKTFFKIIYFSVLTAVIFPRCTPKPIDIDVKPAEEKLVIASQIIPNSIMVVGLTRSFSALDPGGQQDTLQNNFLSRILVSNAIITVTHPAGTDTLYMIAPGIYGSINILYQDYGMYTINATDPSTGEHVTATTELLPQERFDTIWPYISVSGTDSFANVHYEITDQPGGDNHYVACYYQKKQNNSAFDINSYFQRGYNNLNSFDLISESDFDANGKLSRDVPLNGVGVNDTIAVTVSHITQGYYEFLSAYKRSGNLFNQLTGEPINYPTNVIGGYGYFNTHFPDIRIYELINYH